MCRNFGATFRVALNYVVFNTYNVLCQVLLLEIVQNGVALKRMCHKLGRQ